MISVNTDFLVQKRRLSQIWNVHWNPYWICVNLVYGRVCRSNYYLLFDWQRCYLLSWKLRNSNFCSDPIFLTFPSISLSIFSLQKPDIYQILANVMEIPQNWAVYWYSTLQALIDGQMRVQFFYDHPSYRVLMLNKEISMFLFCILW